MHRTFGFDWEAAANVATDTLSQALGGGLGQDLVRSVRLDTAYLPPMDLVGGSGETPEGQPPSFDLGAFLKPKLTIQLAAGNPIVYAPYGDPGEASWLPLFAVAGLLFYVAYRAGQRSRR